FFFFFQAEDGIRDFHVTGVQTCALPILGDRRADDRRAAASRRLVRRGLSVVRRGGGAGNGRVLRDRAAPRADALRSVAAPSSPSDARGIRAPVDVGPRGARITSQRARGTFARSSRSDQ